MKRFLIIIMVIFVLTLLLPYIIISKLCGIYTLPGAKKSEAVRKNFGICKK